ncbi:MAG TPA: type VI secretion IcmF C-terminal domain-containing protein, partial [Nannocystis sp.]
EELRHLYAERYIQAWSDFFERLRLDSPANWTEAVAITTDLTRQDPLKIVFQAIADNTQKLPPIDCSEKPKGLAKWVPMAPPPVNPIARNSTDVAARFARLVAFAFPPAPPPGSQGTAATARLASYQQRLAELRAAAEKAKANPTEANVAGEAATGAQSHLHELVLGASLGNWQESVERLLRPPLDGIALLSVEGVVGKLNREWCDAVVRPIEQTIAGLYPFAPGARIDARLDSIKLLFAPQTGVIAKFRQDNLTGYVEDHGNEIHVRDIGAGAPLHLNRSVVELLDAAHKLGLLLYRDAEIGVDMNVLLSCEQSIQKVVLTIDDVQHEYLCTKNSARQIQWPGKGSGPHQALLDVKGENGRNDRKINVGDFGLIRMLEDGGPRRRAGHNSFALVYDFKRFNLGNLDMVVDPTPTRGGDVFHGFGVGARFLAPFRAAGFVSPPHSLFAESGYSCGAP